jgi:hypothetical protein
MTRRQPLFAVFAVLSLPLWGWADEGQETEPGVKVIDGQAFGDIGARTNGDPVLLNQPPRFSEYVGRFGWWAMWNKGSPAKTGEYQDLKPSPFWDLDGLTSDGRQTLNFYGTGTDNESSKAGLNYYRGDFRANVDYERFPHRLDHDPMNNLPNYNSFSDNPKDPEFIKQDLNVGKDYVMRVQELNASFKKNIGDNLKVRLDVWGMQKDGNRQVSAIAKCYTQTATTPPPGHPPVGAFSGQRCHVLSQMQQIDWTTTEIKPVIEARLGDNITVEYSRPMRSFSAADSTASRYYDFSGRLTYNATTNPNPYANAVVPDGYTQMDQLKIGAKLSENTQAYANLMIGDTVEREIDMDRWFNNTDLRITNTSVENLSLTGYGKIFNEDESFPNLANVLRVNRGPAVNGKTNDQPTSAVVSGSLFHPINYHNTTAGLKGVWRPYGGGYSTKGLALVGGYEYCELDRQFATHTIAGDGIFNQPHTTYNSFQIGPDYRWSSRFDTYLRYKYQNTVRPLVGLQQFANVYNTMLPENDHIVEMGFNWFPSDWFLLNATIGVERADNHSRYADFDEENYPMSFTAWYAVNCKFSLSAGYSVYSNFVTQDITLADQLTSGSRTLPVTGQWNYGGQAHVISFGSRYAMTDQINLTGQVEWVRGDNSVNNSPMTFVTSPTTVTPQLGTYSRVLNETTRVTMGVDWAIRPRVVNYYRYELYDFLDKAPGYQTGMAQGIMGGLSAMF